MKQKKPDRCKGCVHYHNAGHKEGTPLHNSKYDNWCCKFSTAAPKAISVCIAQDGRKEGA